jgi:outer membrane protein assembly factor BamB
MLNCSYFYVVIPVQKYVDNEVDALRASDGTLLWHAKTSLGGAVVRKAVIGDLLYLAANDRLCAFSVTNGALRWCSDQAHDVALQGSGGVIYTTTAQQVCALQASDGKKLWCAQYPNLGATIIASDTIVYVASNFAGTLYALRKSDGSKLWYRQFDHFIFTLAFDE